MVVGMRKLCQHHFEHNRYKIAQGVEGVGTSGLIQNQVLKIAQKWSKKNMHSIPMNCHVIFGHPKYSFPPERIFQLPRKINDPP